MFQGADVDGLTRIAQQCQQSAQVADEICAVLEAIVAASWAFGPFGAAFTSYLKTVVIPWLKRISQALKLFAKVLSAHAQAQQQASAGYAEPSIAMPTYTTPQLPAGDTRQFPVLPATDQSGGTEGAAASKLPETYDRSLAKGGALMSAGTLSGIHAKDDELGGGLPVQRTTQGSFLGQPYTTTSATVGAPPREGDLNLLAGHSLLDGKGALLGTPKGAPVEAKLGYAEGNVSGAAGWSGATGLGAGVVAAGAIGLAQVKGQQNLDIGKGFTLDASEQAAVDARAKGSAFAGASTESGHVVIGAGANVDGFAGVEASAKGSVGYGDLVRAGVEGRLQAGVGGAAGANASWQDGHLLLGAQAGATVGVGGKVAGYVDVNVGELAKMADQTASSWLSQMSTQLGQIPYAYPQGTWPVGF
ncbi:MAG: hypothetical protein ACJ73S_02815 [Mycobacteriales bacterium]